MKQSELVAALSVELQQPKKNILLMFRNLELAIIDAVKNDSYIVIPKLGTLRKKFWHSRLMKRPNNAGYYTPSAKIVVNFLQAGLNSQTLKPSWRPKYTYKSNFPNPKIKLTVPIGELGYAQKDEFNKFIQVLGRFTVEQVAIGEQIIMPRIGTFSPQIKAAKKVNHPHTGAPMIYPARLMMKFRQSNVIRDIIN
jgi:nucleoid DNA-binding protein